jgi:osmotically-inducible protein OsmY
MDNRYLTLGHWFRENENSFQKEDFTTKGLSSIDGIEAFKIYVYSNALSLTGIVGYQKKNIAQELEDLEDLYEVTYISSGFKDAPTIVPVTLQDQIIKEFKCNPTLDSSSIEIEVDGDKVTLKGIVYGFDAFREVMSIVWSVPGVNSVIDQLIIF